jgi:hypothetical protein
MEVTHVMATHQRSRAEAGKVEPVKAGKVALSRCKAGVYTTRSFNHGPLPQRSKAYLDRPVRSRSFFGQRRRDFSSKI